MKKVVGVRFDKTGKIYNFDPQGIELVIGDYVVVETERGTGIASVVVESKLIPEEKLKAALKNVVRRATSEDLEQREKLRELEKKGFEVCKEKILKHELPMKLVDVKYIFDGSKATFFFTADGRVDFRELVKDLAAELKIRVEMRQIGVRDEARMLGGLGCCGLQLCCNTFLNDFEPVSIAMAKDQHLTLNPTKISGMCGRLMCCLTYEYGHYQDCKKRMPKPGSRIKTPQGDGIVKELYLLSEKVLVTLETGQEMKFSWKELQNPKKGEGCGECADKA